VCKDPVKTKLFKQENGFHVDIHIVNLSHDLILQKKCDASLVSVHTDFKRFQRREAAWVSL
jgi:hypothetical protein